MKDKIIKCPHCGAEYLPSEIFMPEDFLETPTAIHKDANGIIEHYSVDDACLEEDYVCDYCNKLFTAKATLEFSTKDADEFEDEYTIIL